MKQNTKITIIIPILNSEKTIKKCIDSLLQQKRNVEIITVYDQKTTDKTYSILKKYKNKIKITKTNGVTPAKSRNIGAKKSTANLLFFADSDTVYEPNYIQLLEKHINNKDIGAVVGRGFVYKPKGIHQTSKDVDRRIRTRRGYKIFGLSTGWIIKKEIYQQIGGYPENFEYGIPEDHEIASRLYEHRYKVQIENQARYHEIERSTIKEDLYRYYRRGQGYAKSKTTKEQKKKYIIPYVISSAYISLIPISLLYSIIKPIAILYIIPYIINILKKYNILAIKKSEIIYLMYFKTFSIILSIVQLAGFLTKMSEQTFNKIFH